MMKIFSLLIFFFALAAAQSPSRILQILRLLSSECSNHGYLWKGQCFCVTTYTGPTCSQKKGAEISDDSSTKCDDLILRLDNLYNISPDFYLFDDDEFPRITRNSIDGTNSQGSWTRMHDISPNFHIFSEETSALDIRQGSLGDCYLLAAFASLANRNNGSVLKEMFFDVNDNPKHVYVTSWLVNGKPRIIAVDDWVPGKNTGSSYSKISTDKDFWPLILEKAYAKIHGNYKIITGGWQTAVWSAISLARTFNKWHSSINASELYDFLDSLFKKNFVVGSATVSQKANNEVGGHAYSVLGVYEVTLDDKQTKVKLVRYFNPWHSEVWKTNPWGDASANWTDYVKSQVPYIKGNDGIVFSTIEDYHANFGVTNWAEIHDHYDVSFIDIAFNHDDTFPHPFEVNFTYYGDDGNDLYIFNDQSDGRLLLGCSAPVSISGFSVFHQNGTEFKASGSTVKIENAPKGKYVAKFYMRKNQNYTKSFTITGYSQEGKLNFIPPNDNVIIDLKKKQCPENCNLQGSCNTFDGKCRCYFGFEGEDCGKISQKKCTNCPHFGVCDEIFGVCILPSLYNLGGKKFLIQGASSLAQLSQNQADKWEILSDGHIKNLITNRYLDVSGGNLKTRKIITYGFGNGTNQIWNLVYLGQNKFVITTALNKSLALAPRPDFSSITLLDVNTTDENQLFSWKAQTVECPDNCNGKGVCSHSTGVCVCQSGYVGDSCNMTETLLECPKNCSGNGKCDQETGYCNCQSDFVGEACDILYADVICPNNCSNNGKCSLDLDKCICNSHFSGQSCEVMEGGFISSLKNAFNGKFLSLNNRNQLLLLNESLNWNLTLEKRIIATTNQKCLAVSGSYYQPNAYLNTYSCSVDLSNPLYQWTLTQNENFFSIRTQKDHNLALTISKDGNSVTIDYYNKDDPKQKWTINH